MIKPKENFGKILAEQRRLKRLSLDFISKKIKIPFKYLEALEYADFNNLPCTHWKKFLKQYSGYLGLNWRQVMRIAKADFKKSANVNCAIDKNYLMSWPKRIKTLVIFLVIAGVLVFLGLKVNQIFSAPFLQIMEPQDNSKTYQKQIKVIGKSQKEAEISINNNPIFVDENGIFETTIDLKKGLNLIKITAKKKYSRIREADLRVLLTEKTN